MPPSSMRQRARRFAIESGVTASMCPASGKYCGERAGELHAESQKTSGSPVLWCMLLWSMLCWNSPLMRLLQTVRRFWHCYTICILLGTEALRRVIGDRLDLALRSSHNS